MKMTLRQIISKCFRLACKLNKKLVVAEYLSALSDNDEENVRIFSHFVNQYSNTLLCVMDQLGYCKRDERLISVIEEHIQMRKIFDRDEEDVGGHIAAFLRRNGERRSKHYYLKIAH